jgi:hypothetical protein
MLYADDGCPAGDGMFMHRAALLLYCSSMTLGYGILCMSHSLLPRLAYLPRHKRPRLPLDHLGAQGLKADAQWAL